MGSKAFGFPRSARLLTAADYSRVFEQAQRSTDRYFTVLWRENGLQHSRLGLAISKKNSRRAVDRNLIKRLARESFRRYRPMLPAVDIVVLSRKGATPAHRDALAASLAQHWKRISAAGGGH